MISGNILPLRFLKYDSEYGKYQYFKNAEDTIIPSAVFVTLSIFPIILIDSIFAKESDATPIAMGIAAITISNLILCLLFAYYLSRESNAIYKTNKSSLILGNQFSTSLYLNILTQLNLALILLLLIIFTTSKNLRETFTIIYPQIIEIPDNTSIEILLFSILFGIFVSIVHKKLFSNKNVFYSTAIHLNLASSIFSIINFVNILRNLGTGDFNLISKQFLNPVKYMFVIEIISFGFLFIHLYTNRGSIKTYIKPIKYNSSKKIEIAYAALTFVIFIVGFLSIGILGWVQLSGLFIIIVLLNVLSARRKRAVDDLIASKTLELEEKNAENEELLLNILPGSIADRLKKGEGKIADHFDIVTVLFADIVGFTKLSQTMSSVELVDKLNELFSAFDQIAAKKKIEKIKTIGDCYMAVAGLPEKQEDHAELVLEMALEMLVVIQVFNQRHSMNLSIRIGINSGEVVAGVIGEHKFIYDLWGDAVNTASRMESHGLPGKIHVTLETYQLLKDKFPFESRGEIEVKGKGKMNTYLVLDGR